MNDILAPNIRRTLTVSSSHVPWEGCAEKINYEQRMGGDDCSFWVQDRQAYLHICFTDASWRIAAHPDNVNAAKKLGWLAIAGLLELAQANNCEYLEIGGDFEQLDESLGFTTYEW